MACSTCRSCSSREMCWYSTTPGSSPRSSKAKEARPQIGATLHKREGPRQWRAFLRNARRARAGDTIDFGAGVAASVAEKASDGSALLWFHGEEPVELLLERAGRMPLPPYIASRREVDEADRERLSNDVRARGGCGRRADGGAALHAAPDRGAGSAGNRPRNPDPACRRGYLPAGKGRGDEGPRDARRMGADRRGDGRAAQRGSRAGGRLIAVGTTSLRLLESAADDEGAIRPFEGDTAIFITPGYRFKAVDGLITNFHLPRSTLFMLVSALMGLDVMKSAYAHAIREGYRFYSYGDASLLLPAAG